MKHLGISLTPRQYEFIKILAKAKYEGRISQAIRSIIQEAIEKP